MLITCIDNSHTWREMLTLGKQYEVVRYYKDKYNEYKMVDIVCDDGKIRTYRGNRFKWGEYDE